VFVTPVIFSAAVDWEKADAMDGNVKLASFLLLFLDPGTRSANIFTKL